MGVLSPYYSLLQFCPVLCSSDTIYKWLTSIPKSVLKPWTQIQSILEHSTHLGHFASDKPPPAYKRTSIAIDHQAHDCDFNVRLCVTKTAAGNLSADRAFMFEPQFDSENPIYGIHHPLTSTSAFSQDANNTCLRCTPRWWAHPSFYRRPWRAPNRKYQYQYQVHYLVHKQYQLIDPCRCIL